MTEPESCPSDAVIRQADDADSDAVIALLAAAYAEHPGCILDVDGVPLPTQPLMVADRYDSNKLFLVRSLRPQFGGTTFYEYDRATDTVVATHNAIIPLVRSVAFSVFNPARMILGFEIVL